MPCTARGALAERTLRLGPRRYRELYTRIATSRDLWEVEEIMEQLEI
jgi:hypothetical protein